MDKIIDQQSSIDKQFTVLDKPLKFQNTKSNNKNLTHGEN